MYKVDVYLRVRRAVMVEGMSIQETARTFGLHRDTVRKMLAYSVPPGYRRQSPPRKPKLEPFTGVIDRILEDDLLSGGLFGVGTNPLRLKVAQVVTALGVVKPEHLVFPAQAKPQHRAVSLEDAVRLAAQRHRLVGSVGQPLPGQGFTVVVSFDCSPPRSGRSASIRERRSPRRSAFPIR